MAVELRGFDDLQNDLQNMAAEFENGQAVGKALKAGAVPIEVQMRSNASHDPKIITNKLHGNISTGNVKKSRKRGSRITIGVHRKDWDDEEYYPAYVEYGHGGPSPAPAHPFVRPAFDTKAPEAYDEMKRVLRDELKRR